MLLKGSDTHARIMVRYLDMTAYNLKFSYSKHPLWENIIDKWQEFGE